jgi:hypothetical protein
MEGEFFLSIKTLNLLLDVLPVCHPCPPFWVHSPLSYTQHLHPCPPFPFLFRNAPWPPNPPTTKNGACPPQRPACWGQPARCVAAAATPGASTAPPTGLLTRPLSPALALVPIWSANMAGNGWTSAEATLRVHSLMGCRVTPARWVLCYLLF